MLYYDPLTKEAFAPKRYNQKFASRKNQIKYNNILARRKRLAKIKIDQPLDRNRTILKGILNGKAEQTKSKDWLLALGYRFGYYTHNVKYNDKSIPCVYEFALEYLGNDKFKIIRNGNN